jgi:hypothetical protein
MKRHAIARHVHKSKRPAKPGARRLKVTLMRCLMLTFLLAPAASIFSISPQTLDMTVQGIKAEREPAMVGDVLILTLRPDHPCHFVGARFQHEGWKVLHPYNRNGNGIYVLDFPVPEGVRDVGYRVVVDGQWMADPTNPRSVTDAAGVECSLFTLEREPARPVVSPRREADGSVTFTFTGTPARRVTLVGDFNNWDPVMDALDETAPGTYAITMRLPPGPHWYYFSTEGRVLLDRYNAAAGLDPDGLRVSYLSGRF